MLSAFSLAAALLGGYQSNANMDLNGPFIGSVSHPEAVLGYSIGSRITTYREQEKVLELLLRQSAGKAKRIDYGVSYQNFPLRVYAISSAENIKRLDEIQKAIEAAAKAGTKPPSNTPAIVWVNETIHGNEPASFESGMMLAYNLIAGKGAYAKSLDNIVVILNPCYNPDGHERFAVSYNSYARGDYAPGNYEATELGPLWGRFNHYRFDMNRDRVSFSQRETQAEVALMQKWRPQVYLDQHGQVENYFFPPNPMSINKNVDRDRLNKWTDILGKSCAKAFDKTGWSYFIREDFDFYYPGYLDIHATLSGAIGITHETDGGKVLNKTRQDGSVVSLREGAAKHLTTALACIDASSARKDELLTDWATYKKSAVTGEHADGAKRYYFTSDDVRPLDRLKSLLEKTGIESKFVKSTKLKATNLWTSESQETTLEEHTLAVDLAQEFGPIAKTLFETVSEFEKEFIDAQQNKAKTAPEGENYPGAQGTEFYDMTGWSVPFAHGIKCFTTDGTEPLKAAEGRKPLNAVKENSLGYVLRYSDQSDVLAAMDLARQGVKVSFLREDAKLAGNLYSRGTFVIFSIRNDKSLIEKIDAVQQARNVQFEALPTSYPDSGREGPGNRLSAIRTPQIGVIFGSATTNLSNVSGTWFALQEQLKVPFTALNSGAISNKVLQNYSVIVSPPGSGVINNPRVKDWVRDGGVLIAIGDVPNSVAAFQMGSTTRSVPGSIFRAKLEKRSVLSFGYASTDIAVPVNGSEFPKIRKEGGAVVSFAADSSKKLMTGWSWGEETEKALAGTVWMHDEPLGSGHIVWFAEDPNDRVMWQGLNKLFLNSLVLLSGN